VIALGGFLSKESVAVSGEGLGRDRLKLKRSCSSLAFGYRFLDVYVLAVPGNDFD
jgi:hypothetical protein